MSYDKYERYDHNQLGVVFEAVNAAALAMPSLRKGDRNQHGGYQYVSIDDYYEKAASVAHKQGLNWTIRELSSEKVMVGEKVGAGGVVVPVHALKIAYEVDLMHTSGVILDGFFAGSILHPLQGAQTAGSAMSYVAKLFMRAVFNIVTGEQDADATEGDAFDLGGKATAPKPGPKPTPPAIPGVIGKATGQTGVGSIVVTDPTLTLMNLTELATAFLPLAKTPRELTQYWVDNEADFKELENERPTDYATLVAAFAARKKELASK